MKAQNDMNLTPRERIGRMLGRVNRTRFQLSEILLDRMGIGPGQVPILYDLKWHKELTQRQLAEHTHVTAATISGTLKRMERAGLVYRTDDEKDARISIVRLTDEGKERGEQAGKLFVQTDYDMLKDFSEAECEALLGYLERMCENVGQALEAQTANPDKNQFPNKGA